MEQAAQLEEAHKQNELLKTELGKQTMRVSSLEEEVAQVTAEAEMFRQLVEELQAQSAEVTLV